MDIRVLYEDNHLLVVEKPANVPVQADASGDEDLLTACKGYIKDCSPPARGISRRSIRSPGRSIWAWSTGWIGPWGA